MTTLSADQIRSIVRGGGQRSAVPTVTSETQERPFDPLGEAVELLKTHTRFTVAGQRGLDAVSIALGEARDFVTRKPDSAVEALEKPCAELRKLKEMIDASLAHMEHVVREAKRLPGMTESRVHEIDRALYALTEGVDTSLSKNDYSSQLAASAAEAERFIGSVKQLKVGANVGVGRNAYQVVNTPTKRGAEWFVALSGPGMGKADGYSLLVPEHKTTGVYEAMLVHEKSKAKVGLFLADIKLEAVDGSQYGDFGPAMGRIEPGDTVRLTKQVFRVIGKSGSAALIQPEKIAAEVYGGFRPAMGYVASPGDFPGRGGKDFQDTSTSEPKGTQPQGQAGHASLVGTTVLNYNPHTGQYSFPSGKLPGEYEMADTIQIVGHQPGEERAYFGESRMTVERFTLMIQEAAGKTTVEKLQSVAAGGEPMKVNGYYVDPESARVILMVHEALGEDNRNRMDGMAVQQMVTVAWRMANQQRAAE